MKVLILGPKARYEAYMPEFVAQLPFETAYCSLDQSPQQAARENADAQILFTDPIVDVTGELMDLMPGLKLIQSEGVAYNRIDLEAARARNIFVCNNKGCNAASVAEHTVMLMLMALRHGITGHNALRAGRQREMKEAVMASNSPELGLSTVGLVGLGDIGTATARLLVPFGCKMYYYTAHRRPPQVEEELNVEYLPLEELVSRCDIVSLHCAVTPETTHMVDKALLDKFKPGAILVNTSRACWWTAWPSGGPSSTADWVPSLWMSLNRSPLPLTTPWWTSLQRSRIGPSTRPIWAAIPAAPSTGPTPICGPRPSWCWRGSGPILSSMGCEKKEKRTRYTTVPGPFLLRGKA